MANERDVHVGDAVIWVDAVGKPSNALVTAVWTKDCINVVIISDDENQKDPYGRQIQRQTSCQHKSLTTVHGFYWMFADEVPNAGHAPLEN